MSREENVAIFEDTKRIYKTNPIISAAVKLSNEHQEIFLEGASIKPVPKGVGIPRRRPPPVWM